jgi:hypothetical protein
VSDPTPDAAPAAANRGNESQSPPAGASPDAIQTGPPRAAPVPPLKLVVTLSPNAEGATRAVLGVGREGCDPVFRTIDGADLRSALDAVPDLVASAEARWRAQPRFPAARAAAPARPTPPPRPASSAAPPARGDPVPTDAAQRSATVPATPTAPAGQLGLFD